MFAHQYHVIFVSLHIRSMWETTVMHKQVSGWTVNFGPNFPDQSLLWNTPPPISENFRFGMTKVYSRIPPPILENFRFGMTKVYSGIPPISENFRFGMTKVYSRIPPPPFRKTSDLGWPKFTPEYPPHFGKLQIWHGQSLLQNTPPAPPPRKLSESPGPTFSEYRALLHVETLSNPDNY